MASKKIVPLEVGDYGLVKAFKGPHKGKVFDYDDDGYNYGMACAICYENDAFTGMANGQPYYMIPHRELTPYLRKFMKMFKIPETGYTQTVKK